MRRRGLVFALVVAGCLAVAVAAVAWAVVTGDSSVEQDDAAPGAPRVRVDALEKPLLVFQHVVRDDDYAHVAVIPATGAPARRTISGLVCERVHFAAGRGLCLMPKRGLGIKYRAMVISSDFRVRHELTLGGLLSRARVSPDGRYGATTSFVNGHSYAERGAFSTQTTLIELARGKALADLEDFEVTKDGERFEAIDHNFWGVTFARDSNRFYATLETRGKTYLVEGDVAARGLRVLHENVECPSLSPDETRVAYKKRLGRGEWRLHVLDLATMAETPLAEERSIDDQVEWLDDRRILYGTREGEVWVVPADGKGRAARYLTGALSPAVVR
jgi:dipeptidyl aminopeptidase/acylaminoacyl peptidase